MRSSLAVLATILALQACGGDKSAQNDSAAAAPPAARPDSTPRAATATAPVKNAAGRDLGTLTLTESSQGLTLTGRLTGLAPGEHGVHIHMVGQCQPPFTSAGGHWNPTNRQHGSQNPQGPHLGDMPNLTVGADSSANVQVTTTGGTLKGANALLDADGAAVVVHAKADDLKTDPSGNSGDRVACGVITGA
jgi:Cu-Zn family superoxide dismutase